MKQLLLIVAGLFCFVQSFAQSEISISTGLSFPAGDFGSSSGGAAKIGVMGDIMYQQQTQDKSKLWIAGMIRLQSYKVDIAQFEQAFPGARVSATNWDALSFLVGPVVKFELSETSSFEPRILLGYLTAKSPNVAITSGTATAVAESADAGSFATLVGTCFKFRASAKMNLVAGLDYLTANPKFNVTASGGGMSVSEKSNQQISSFSVTIGVSFKLK